ncbi:MAG: ATP-grasp domain-containing protein [Candidatus Woesearchaeota archaeon]
MRILALYLKEEIKIKRKGREKFIERIPASDLQVCNALEELGYFVEKMPYDPEKGLRLNKRYDLIFNLCDGLEGDNNFIEFKVLKDIEKTRIPFTGNNLRTVMLCNDKRKIKKVLVKNRILTPKYQVFTSVKQKLNHSLKFPLMVKPVCADGAVGIYADSVVHDENSLRKNIKRVIERHNQPALVEEYINGRDLIIPVVGKNKIFVLNPAETKYLRSYNHRPKILSHSAKWDSGKQIYKDCITLVKNAEKRFTEHELKLIKSIAARVYKVMGCDGYATVDARLNKNGNLYVIEINPNCWIGKNSETALAFKAKGIDYAGFISRIVKIAIEK